MARVLGLLTLIALDILCMPSTIVQAQQGRAIVKIKLQKFDSRGKDSDGDRCDPSWWPGGRERCDPKFRFCVDKYSGGSSVTSCEYFKKQTGHYTDDDVVGFDDEINGMDNPIVVSIKNYEGIRFKVDVDDKDDGNGDDDIDTFDWRYDADAGRSESETNRKEIKIEGKRRRSKAKLEFWIKVYCAENSYGSNCSVYCVPVDNDDEGHYGCDPDTGARYCLDGWEDLSTDCLIRVDNCEDYSCANGGVCVDEYNGFSCECRPGFTGNRCQTEINECASNPCLNGGTCTDHVNGYTCDCTSLYAGDHCQHHVCQHPDSYCLNGGTCYEVDNDTIACVCPQQYSGIHCDVDACQILNCSHGVCVNGVCECEPHFLGGLCDVRECEQIPCLHGGTCLNSGYCACQDGYNGTFCENMEFVCESRPCLNNGECVHVNNSVGYRCRCQPGYNGTLCGNKLPVDGSYDDQGGDEEQTDAKETGHASIPTWALILIVAVAFLLLIIVLIVALLLKYRRKYKKSVENPPPRSPDNMENFVNPLYSENQPSPPSVSYSASANAATVTTTAEKKALEDEADYGAAAPPPYTPHPDDMSKIPLPSYEQSQGAVGFMNQAYGPSTNDKGELGDTDGDNKDKYRHLNGAVPSGGGYDNPIYANNNNAEPIYLEPAPRTCSPPKDEPSSGDPLYAEVPAPRPVEPSSNPSPGTSCAAQTPNHSNVSPIEHTYLSPRVDRLRSTDQTSAKYLESKNNNATSEHNDNENPYDVVDTSMVDNDLNASLEGSKM